MWFLTIVLAIMCVYKDKFMESDTSIKGNVICMDLLKVSIKKKYMILIRLKDDSHQFIGTRETLIAIA